MGCPECCKGKNNIENIQVLFILFLHYQIVSQIASARQKSADQNNANVMHAASALAKERKQKGSAVNKDIGVTL